MNTMQMTTRSIEGDCSARTTFSTWDGQELFYRAWLPQRAAHKAIILVHRGHEHSGRWHPFVQELGFDDVSIFACDMRGHGQSPGERGYADSFTDHVRDLDAFVKYVSATYDMPVENIIVLGHSVGAVTVSAWVHDYAPRIRGMVLATPALRIKLYIPLARQGLAALRLVKRRAFIKSYVKPSMLTHDARQAAEYAADPLISRQTAVNVLLDLHMTSTRLIDDAAAIRTPALLLAAGSDWVVKNSAIRAFYDRLGSRQKSLHILDGFSHAIFHEAERSLPISLVRHFVRDLFRASAGPQPLLDADQTGFARREFDRLSKPRPIYCAKRWSFAAQKVVMKTFGRLGEGIRIGWKHGFDSGQSLDHVYRNEARGITPLGRWIDRVYLNSIGWTGIRVRRTHLQRMLRRAIDLTLQSKPRAQIVDIASGPGRYLLEAVRDLPQDRVSVLLRDCNENGLARARHIAATLNLKNASCECGDAFDSNSLAALQPRPNIAIISGLFELFGDNRKVQASLRGLAAAMRDGGYLIYTNQPWHPQIEMIARVLRNRDGQPWIMRRRTQEEMDDLVRDAGFEKIDMLIDNWGIFTVSLARRA